MDLCLQRRQIPESTLLACLSDLAGKLRSCLGERGAMFSGDLARSFGVPVADMQRALWELVAAGLVTADGFDSLRVLIDPRRQGGRKSGFGAPASAAPRAKVGHGAGRWSLLCGETLTVTPALREARLESACTVLLRRYGVIFRDLLAREETMPHWRDLLGLLRRMEACAARCAEGSFSPDFGGEQFALPEASVESLSGVAQDGHDAGGRSHRGGGRSVESGWHCGPRGAGCCRAGKDGCLCERMRLLLDSRW